MVDLTIFDDPMLKKLIVAIVAGLSLGMLLETIIVYFAGSVFRPFIFIGVFALTLTFIYFWSQRQE